MPTPTEERADGSPTGRRRRVLRIALLVLVVAPVVLITGAVLLLQIEGVSTATVNAALSRFNPWPDARLRVGSADLSGLGHLTLTDLMVDGDDGSPTVRLDTLEARYHLLALIQGRLEIPRLRIAGADVALRQNPDSTWDLLAPFSADSAVAPADTAGGAMPIRLGATDIRRVRVRASFGDSLLRVEDFTLRLDTFATGTPMTVVLDTVHARIYPPGRPDTPARFAGSLRFVGGELSTPGIRLESDSSDVRAVGTLRIPDRGDAVARDIDFRLQAQPLDFRDVGALVPGFDLPGSLRLDAHVGGSSALMEVRADAESFDGGTVHMEGTLTPRTTDSVRYALTGRVRDVDPGLWTGDSAFAVRGVDADFAVDLSGPTLATVSGTATFDADGARLGQGTLRRTHVGIAFDGGTARLDVDGAAAPWAAFTATGTARPFDSIPSYDVRASLQQLDPIAAGGTRLASGVARIEARGEGVQPSLAQGRATAELSGMLGDVDIRGGSFTATWDSATARVRLKLPIGDGSVDGRGRVAWGGPALRMTLDSFDVSRLAVADLLGDTVSGSLSLNGTAEAVLGDRGATLIDVRAALEQASWQELTVDTGEVALHVERGEMSGHARVVAAAGTAFVDISGQPFDSVPVWRIDSLRVRGLNLAEARAGMPVSDIDATGTLEARGKTPARMTLDGRIVLDSSTVAASRLDAATVDVSLREGRLELTADGRVLDGSVAFAAEGRPFDTTPSFRVTRGRFEDLLVDSTLAGPVRGRFSGTLEATGALPPDTFPQLRGRLRLDGGRLNDAAIEDASVDFEVEGSDATFDATARLGGGSADVHATAGLVRDTGVMGLRGLRAKGNIDLPRLARVLGRDSVDGALRARFDVAGSGTALEDMNLTADIGASGNYGRARLDSVAVHARLDDGLLRVDTLALTSNVARGGGSGSVALFDRTVVPDSVADRGIHLRIDADSLDAVADLLGPGPLAARTGSLVVDARRRGGAVHVEGTAAAGGAISGRLAADSLHLDFDARFDDGRFGGVNAQIRGDQLAGPIGVLEGAGGTVTYDSTGAAFALSIRKDAEHAMRLVGQAQLADSTVRLDSVDVDMPQASWHLAETTTLGWGRRLDAGDLTLVSGNSRVALAGHLDTHGTQDLTVQLDSVPLAGLADLAGMQRVTGSVDGRLEVTGSAARPDLNGELSATVNGAAMRVALGPDPAGLRVDLRLEDREGEPLTVEGTLPFGFSLAPEGERAAPTDEVALDIGARAFSLDWLTPILQPMGVSDVQGALTADARLAGTFGDPELTGSFTLDGGKIVLPDQGVAYSSIHGLLEFQGDRLTIRTLEATSSGTATITGDVLLEPLNEPRLDLTARFRRFHAVDNAWTDLRMNGDVTVTGDALAPVIEGSVQLEGTDVYADLVGQGASVESVALTDEDYRMLESYWGYTPSNAAATQTEPMETWAIDVSVDLGSDVWLRRRTTPEMRVQLTGSVDARKEPGDSIQLFGTIEALAQRSYFEQFGRRFSVTQGAVTFNGPPTDFRVTAEARYEVPSFRDPSASEVAITLDVTGAMDDLSLTLGSEPSMENADVVSYLATGRPAASATAFGGNDRGGGGGVLGVGEELALGRITGLVESAATEAVGLDVVEIRQTGSEGATLVAGRYVNPRLFVGFQQPLTLTGRREEGAGGAVRQTEVELEYTWYRWLLVNLQGGQSTLRLFFRTKWTF